MPEPLFTEAERRFLTELSTRGIRYLLVGMSAALLQGARGATEDIDIWLEDLDHPALREAARAAGGFFVGFGLATPTPPMLGGDELGARLDLVVSMHGLGSFADEYPDAVTSVVDGLELKLLPLQRIRDSKAAAGRAKDRAALPALDEALAVLEES